MTKPQIELLLHDQPVVDYGSHKREKGKAKDYSHTNLYEKAMEAMARTEALRGDADVLAQIEKNAVSINI